NWVFQISETGSAAACLRATRTWLALCAIGPLFLGLAAIEATHAPWSEVAFHFGFGGALALVLMELLFLDFRKVPFTCSPLPGKVNLVFLSVLYVFGFTFYSSYMASFEDWLWKRPGVSVVFFVVVSAGLGAIARARGRMLSNTSDLTFEDDADPSVRQLGLS